ncbi:hypothetical protein Dsin_029926 [Dipteronia sinensis]|uniref:Ubiquitin-like domain-containing protein n=1 Tax=Dipteronia sinensis TaxID=43782 RepID=A0AAD9ZTH0_9ROSI|nr:hypothetical protein Dsin_029926 [Dipteronia sinensis]
MESPEEEINLYFKIIKTIAMKVKRSDTIKDIKAMLDEEEHVPEDVQELFFAGDHLRDGQRILDYGILRNSTVHLVHREPYWMTLHFKMPSNEKTIKLEVQEHYTIQKIKSIIQDEEGICPCDFEIYSCGKLLENHRTMASLNIQSEDTLQMISNRKETRSLYVQTPTKGSIKVEVRSVHTVLDVKKIIESIINIPSQCMKLIRTEEQLEDWKTLACYDINEGDVLTVEIPDKFQISVITTFTGEIITLDVFPSSTVANVKDLLSRLNGIPVKHQKILLNGGVLKDSRTLASYSIDKESILHMMLIIGGTPEDA